MSDAFLQRFARHGGHPRVGKVALLEEIGRGGMGTVYAGWHMELDIPVAVKFLFALPGRVGERSAAFAAKPGCVPSWTTRTCCACLDFGTEEDVPYLVMEWVPGKGLDRVVAVVGPLTEEEVVTVLRDVGQALMTLHRRGIVHRDIKPANLLLRSTDGRIKIADLGIAKELQAKDAIQTHQIVGTPAFVSPEQIRDPANVGPASDLFSLGATAYFLLTGRLPFAGRDVMEVFEHILHQPLPHPSSAGVQVSDRLVEVLQRLTAKEVSQRDRLRAAIARSCCRAYRFLFVRPCSEASRPEYEVCRPEGLSEADRPARSPATAEHAAETETMAWPLTSSTVAAGTPPRTAPRSLLFCQCLQNDFIAPLREGEAPPNKLHIGWEEATRIVGPDPATRPARACGVGLCRGRERPHRAHSRLARRRRPAPAAGAEVLRQPLPGGQPEGPASSTCWKLTAATAVGRPSSIPRASTTSRTPRWRRSSTCKWPTPTARPCPSA